MVQEKKNSPHLLGIYYKSRRHTVIIRLLFKKVKQNKKGSFFFLEEQKGRSIGRQKIKFQFKRKGSFYNQRGTLFSEQIFTNGR